MLIGLRLLFVTEHMQSFSWQNISCVPEKHSIMVSNIRATSEITNKSCTPKFTLERHIVGTSRSHNGRPMTLGTLCRLWKGCVVLTATKCLAYRSDYNWMPGLSLGLTGQHPITGLKCFACIHVNYGTRWAPDVPWKEGSPTLRTFSRFLPC